MVIWLIGLAGSGKTTIGAALYKRLKLDCNNLVFIDGDMIRAIMGDDLGYDIESRRRNAKRIRNLCKELEKQSVNVICAILSIFPEDRKWNRQNYNEYFEIYLNVDMDTLIRRDQKQLYSRAIAGSEKNVVGIDIPFPKPESPDLVIDNNANLVKLDSIIDLIIKSLPEFEDIH